MEEKTDQLQEVAISKLEPIIPLLQKYIGLPYPQLELECLAAKMETNPDFVHTYQFYEFVSQKTIEELLHRYFEKTDKEDEIIFFLWIVANLFYSGNYASYESYEKESYLAQEEQRNIREEIAQLYSYIQKRKQIRTVAVGDNALSGKPIEFVSDDKTELRIDNTNCWFEAMLEHYLFPNCLPDVVDDKDAERIWKKDNKPAGRKARTETNAIIHGVEQYLHDEGVINKSAVAPKHLCLFLFDYLDAMGYLNDDYDRRMLKPEYIKNYIHNLREEGNEPQFNNYTFEEGLPSITVEDVAYTWLFNPLRYKVMMVKRRKELEKEEKLEEIQKPNEKKSIGTRIDLLLSHTRDIFRKGVYKKEKKENTSQS